MDGVSVTSRPMGQTEKLFYKMQEYGGANTCAIAEVRGTFSAEAMKRAVAQVAARHALFRCRVELQDGWPQFVLHGPRELPFAVIEGGSSDVVDEQICTLLETDFYQQPWLWQVTCVLDGADDNRFWLLLAINHSIADGAVLCYTVKNLLSAFVDPAALSGDEATELEPTLESYLKYRVGMRDHFNFWPLQLRKQMFPTDTVAPDAKVDSSGRKTRLVFRQFDAAFSEQLRKQARFKGTTVNAALTAAILFSAARRIDAKRRLRLSIDTNVSFRKQFGLPNDQAGPHVSILSAIYKLNDTRQFWDVARECKQTLVAAQDKQLHWAANHMWESLQRWMSDASRMKYLDGEKLGRLDMLGISNVGDLDIPTQMPGLTVENLRFLASQHGFGFYFAFYVCSQGGKLQLSMAHAEPVVSRATAQAFMGSVAELLERALVLDDFSLADLAADSPASELSADGNIA